MKKITIFVTDDEPFELTPDMMARLLELHIERVPDTPNTVRRRRVVAVHRGKDGMNLAVAIMRHYTAEGMFARTLAIRWITEEKFSERSISPALSVLKKQGFIEEIDKHYYKFLKPYTK